MWQPGLVGWLIGDGYYGGESVRLSSCDEEINSSIYANFDCHKEDGHITALGKEYMDTRINGIQKNLRDLGIFKQSKLRKTLPKDVHTYCEQDVCEMLGGLFDTDGCVHYTGSKSARFVELCSMSYSLLDDVRMLLQRIGIECNISSRKPRVTLFSKGVAESYTLVISRAMSVLRFAEKISFSVGYKQDRLGIVVDHLLGKERNRKNRRGAKPNGLGFERVVSVEPIGDKLVYNLTAGKTHTYIANGIVTNNTGGEDDKGNGEFEDEYRSVLGHWNQACATGVQSELPGGVLSSALHADGSHNNILSVPGQVSSGRVTGSPFLQMDGHAVFKFAVKVLGNVAVEAAELAGIGVADVDWVIPHQANIRILQATARRVGIPMEKIIVTV